jgi:hypothetical protein
MISRKFRQRPFAHLMAKEPGIPSRCRSKAISDACPDYNCESFGTRVMSAGFLRASLIDQEISMNTKLLASTLLAASLLGAPAVAFAQSESAAPPPASEAKPMAPTAHHTNKSAEMAGGHFRAGTTTGLGSTSEGRARPGGQSVARKPAD